MKFIFAIASLLTLVFTVGGCRTTNPARSEVREDDVEAATGVTMRPMFLPGQPVLKNIGELIASAQSRVDIAIYMIDVDRDSPLIQAIASDAVQQRLRTGDLKIRMIFEGSQGSADSEERAAALQNLGIEVRHLTSSRKVHHKFALIDPGSGDGKMVMGTANWTLGTEKAYTEAVIFFRNAPGLVGAYAQEFVRLWAASEAYGEPHVQSVSLDAPANARPEEGLAVYFNTENFAIDGTRIGIDSNAPGYALTRRVVAAIDAATPEDTIRVAMTRISLKPVYDAIKRAAARGVTVKLALNQENYLGQGFREEMVEPLGCDGEQAYAEECSTSQNFAYLLQQGGFPGAENVHVRIKYYNHDPRNFLAAQLHAKYFLVGEKQLWIGSFNWSHSSEYKHIENLLQVDGSKYPELLTSFIEQHDEIFELNRRSYRGFLQDFERDLQRRRRIWCQFRPMSLTFEEIDRLLATPARVEEASGRSVRMLDCAPAWARD